VPRGRVDERGEGLLDRADVLGRDLHAASRPAFGFPSAAPGIPNPLLEYPEREDFAPERAGSRAVDIRPKRVFQRYPQFVV
jgi:hypothetical protein